MAFEITNRIGVCEYVTLSRLTKTVAAAGTPERLSDTELFFRKATVVGKKLPRTYNIGIVWIGESGTNDSQLVEIAAAGAAGHTVYISAPTGAKLNFFDFWLDVATAGDGVIVLYS